MIRAALSPMVGGLVYLVCLASPAPAQKPNIVLMLADNLGYGDVGFLGTGGELRGMPTPRIDRLASEGLRFTQFLTEPGCTPSRAALQTGRYPIRLGLSLVLVKGAANTLRAKEITMAEMLKPVGYRTAYVGKWHLGFASESQPQYQGYDEWRIGFLGSTDVTTYGREMSKYHMPQAMIEQALQYVVEAKTPNTPARNVCAFDIAYRRQIEKDISVKTSWPAHRASFAASFSIPTRGASGRSA